MTQQNALQAAIEKLKACSYHVERCEFPPEPMPGLYMVGPRELTEMQVIALAATAEPPRGPIAADYDRLRSLR